MMNNELIANLRQNYREESFRRSDLADNPFDEFKFWFEEAMKAKVQEPNAMTLATASLEGKPSARIVLLKGIQEDGFVFYTNYSSEKGKVLGQNPQAALVFCWLELARQIRIEGRVEKLDAASSEKYFQSRPKDSQIGAWASPQSSVIETRDILEENVSRLNKEYAEQNVLPMPPHWGGYKVVADTIEFWQGRASRLHDRFRYSLLDNASWKIERLAP